MNPLENCTSLGNCIKRAQWNCDQMNNFPHNPPPIFIYHFQILFLVAHRGSLPAITLGWMFPRESKAHGNSVPLAFFRAAARTQPWDKSSCWSCNTFFGSLVYVCFESSLNFESRMLHILSQHKLSKSNCTKKFLYKYRTSKYSFASFV